MITIGVAFALAVAIFWAGDRHGAGRVQAALDAATVAAQAQAMETAKALAVAEQARRALSQALEDAANAEPVTVPAALPLSRVLRLQQRGAASPAPVR